MSDRANTARRPLPRRLFATPESRWVSIVALIIMLIGIIVVGHLYGRYLESLDLKGRENAIEELRAQNQQQKRKIDEQSAQLTGLEGKLKDAQDQLNAITPAANTYTLSPNQTLLVGDGHLALGMIGAPGNEGILLQINGKQQMATVGHVIAVAAEGGANCQVTVQSFDMFKATINAVCPGSKEQQPPPQQLQPDRQQQQQQQQQR